MKLLKPSLTSLRSTLPTLEHQAAGATVERLRGKALQQMRERVFRRAGWQCECPECRAGLPLDITRKTGQIDHIRALHLGGSNDFSNFRAVHVDHHARITADQARARHESGRTWSDER